MLTVLLLIKTQIKQVKGKVWVIFHGLVKETDPTSRSTKRKKMMDRALDRLNGDNGSHSTGKKKSNKRSLPLSVTAVIFQKQ